jgi:chemotaxis protein CheX
MEESTRTLALPEVMDSDTACVLARKLAEHRMHPIKLDASSVEQAGGLCMQVILSARKSWKRNGRTFAIGDASRVFRQSAELLGAGDLLS